MAFQKIMLAVDESAPAKKGLDMAIKVIGESKTPVVLMHVVNTVTTRIPIKQREVLLDEMAKEARQLFGDYRAALEKIGVPVSEIVAEGGAAEEIMRAAKEQGCDLIIMGAEKHSKFGGILLGSVTHKTLYRSEIPVLIAH